MISTLSIVRAIPLCAVAIGIAAAVAHAQSSASPAATPASTASAAPQIQTAARPPAPNRVNEVMPSWLRLRGEFRERLEGFENLGFDETRDDLYWLTRFRITTAVTASPTLSFQMQLQDARVGHKTVGPTAAPFRAPFDLRTAFAQIGSTTSPLTVRLGRQELAFGEQRLVGHVSWLNAARTFDGASATIRRNGLQVDAFATSVVRILDGFDKSGNGNRFAGAYVTAAALVPQASVEPYVYVKRDTNLLTETGAIDDLDHVTVGVRLAGKLPARLDYGVEMALQRGSLGTDDVRAWAGHWQLRKTLPGPGALRLTGEYNYASGDEDPADGVRGTFDQLYPTPHDKYGLADQIGWKNMHHARAGFEVTPVRNLPITTNYHSWWLAEGRDAVYNVGSAPLARVITGAASRHIGQELDVQVSRAIVPQLQVAGGYAHVFPGDFLRQATPGASYSHPYVMVTYVFLAER